MKKILLFGILLMLVLAFVSCEITNENDSDNEISGELTKESTNESNDENTGETNEEATIEGDEMTATDGEETTAEGDEETTVDGEKTTAEDDEKTTTEDDEKTTTEDGEETTSAIDNSVGEVASADDWRHMIDGSYTNFTAVASTVRADGKSTTSTVIADRGSSITKTVSDQDGVEITEGRFLTDDGDFANYLYDSATEKWNFKSTSSSGTAHFLTGMPYTQDLFTFDEATGTYHYLETQNGMSIEITLRFKGGYCVYFIMATVSPSGREYTELVCRDYGTTVVTRPVNEDLVGSSDGSSISGMN